MVAKFQNILIGTINLDHRTSSTKIIMDAVMELYKKIINKRLLVRRINITANNVTTEKNFKEEKTYEQINLFTDYQKRNTKQQIEKSEKDLQIAIVNIKKKYGKNAIIKGMNLQEGSTTLKRNGLIGGHSE